VQAGYVAINVFAEAAKVVGPNLTRDRLVAALGNGTVWTADASLDQRFSYAAAERTGDNWSHDMGQGREFMYRYDSTNTVSSPDGTPTGTPRTRPVRDLHLEVSRAEREQRGTSARSPEAIEQVEHEVRTLK